MFFTINYFQPLEQFELLYFGTFFGLSINNLSIYLTFLLFVIIFIFILINFKKRFIPINLQLSIELIYDFVFNLVKQLIGIKGYAHFPIILTLFLFILISNLLGMALYSFTLTSHVSVAFTLSFSFFIAVVLIGVLIQRESFVNTFIPAGAPKLLKPFIVGIEVVSYFSRPFSLGIRLFANLMAGHTLLAILANFTFLISQKSILIAFVPLVLIIAIVGLEVMIAMLQAYVFTVLTCIYLNDSIHGSH